MSKNERLLFLIGNKKYALKNEKALYPKDLKDYQKIFLDKGIDVKIQVIPADKVVEVKDIL